jgi:hypothetical protein
MVIRSQIQLFESGINAWHAVDPHVLTAIRNFSDALTPSYSLASTRFSIATLFQSHLDDAVESYAETAGNAELLATIKERPLSARLDEASIEWRLFMLAKAFSVARVEPDVPAVHTLRAVHDVVTFCQARRGLRRRTGPTDTKGRQRQQAAMPGSALGWCPLCWRRSEVGTTHRGPTSTRRTSHYCEHHRLTTSESELRRDTTLRPTFEAAWLRLKSLGGDKALPNVHLTGMELRWLAHWIACHRVRPVAIDCARLVKTGASQRQVAAQLNVSQPTVAKSLRNLDSLSEKLAIDFVKHRNSMVDAELASLTAELRQKPALAEHVGLDHALSTPGRFIQPTDQIFGTKMGVSPKHLHAFVPADCRDLLIAQARLDQAAHRFVPKIVKSQV